MNHLFAKLFGFLLNILHIFFLVFIFLWFYKGFGNEYARGGDVALIGTGIFIAYIIVMGVITTFVSIRQNLSEINQKISNSTKL
jgi:Fe2+ transport system protein B